MADEELLQDSLGGVPVNIRIQEDETVGGASVASQGTAAVFQQRARHTLLEIELDKVVVRKGDCGLPGWKVYVTNRNRSNPFSNKQIYGFFPSTV